MQKFQTAHANMRQFNASSGRGRCQIEGHLPQILNILIVALFSLMKTPLLICLSLNSWRTLRTFGATWLIPRIRMQKASLASDGTWKLPSFLASLFNLEKLKFKQFMKKYVYFHRKEFRRIALFCCPSRCFSSN